MHVTVILLTGVIIGLIVRSQRREQAELIARQQTEQTEQNAETNGTHSLAIASDSTADAPTATASEPIIVGGEGWLSKFELTERSGKQVSSDDLLGEPYVVSFFFTTCVATCPMQNEKLKILQEEFYGKGVRFLSISVDPEIDTPEVLTKYAHRFEADPDQWLFLTGDLTYIRRIGAEIFRLPIRRRFHTDRFILVDAAGEIAGIYEWPEPSQFNRLKADIATLLEKGTLSNDATTKQQTDESKSTDDARDNDDKENSSEGERKNESESDN